MGTDINLVSRFGDSFNGRNKAEELLSIIQSLLNNNVKVTLDFTGVKYMDNMFLVESLGHLYSGTSFTSHEYLERNLLIKGAADEVVDMVTRLKDYFSKVKNYCNTGEQHG